MLIAFLKKILAKDLAITACTPSALSTPGACSLEEPQPKFSPPTTKSPGFTFFAKSGSMIQMYDPSFHPGSAEADTGMQ